MKRSIKILLIISCLVPHFIGVAQRHDNHWVLGYDSQNNPSDTVTGTVFVNYDDGEFNVSYPTYDSISFDMWRDCVTMSDEDGNLLFYSNGLQINNANHQVMKGSEDFNYHPFHEQYEDFGLFTNQGSIALPAPGNSSMFYLLHPKINFEFNSPDVYIYSTDLYYSTINMDKNAGLGELIEASVPIVNDTIENFGITAVRHANGRDWWVVVVADEIVNKFYVILIDQSGPRLHHVQDLSKITDHETGVGQGFFTSDGKYYIRNTSKFSGQPIFLDILEFDRCEGTLFNKTTIEHGEDHITAGAAISHNSDFVYTNNGNKLYQFDLRADDIERSMVLIDEYDGYVTPNNFPSTFKNCWLAPDGRIYMTCANGMKPTHVIRHPNRKGKACEFVQREFNFPKANDNSIPNHPNYRLGPIDGNPCDTLGIDNIPLSRWRHDATYRFVEFTNLSDYEPEHWLWTFGDGHMSTDTSPYHEYVDTGWYEVCLTVSNINGADTLCRMIHVRDSLSATSALASSVQFGIYPNPALDYIHLSASENLGWTNVFIYDLKGSLVEHVKKEFIINRPTELEVTSLNSGFYIVEVWKEGLRLGSTRLIVLE